MAKPGLTNNLKFRRLARTLGSHALAYGSLGLIWEASWEACDAVVGTCEDVELAAHWEGAPGALVQALLTAGGARAGFLEPVEGLEGIYQIHDWVEHLPTYVRARLRRRMETENWAASLSEVRSAAARKRWAKSAISPEVDSPETNFNSPLGSPSSDFNSPEADFNSPPSNGDSEPRAPIHANAMQTDAVCMPLAQKTGQILQDPDANVMQTDAKPFTLPFTSLQYKEPPYPPGGASKGKGKTKAPAPPSWSPVFKGHPPEVAHWFGLALEAHRAAAAKALDQAKRLGVEAYVADVNPTKGARAFLARVQSGQDPRVLRAAHLVWLNRPNAKGLAALETFFSDPGKSAAKALWTGYIEEGAKRVAMSIAAEAAPPPPPPPPPPASVLPALGGDLIESLGLGAFLVPPGS